MTALSWFKCVAACGLLVGLVGLPLTAQTPPPTDKKEDEKNPLIEEATKLFNERKFDDAFKKLKEATVKKPSLPPARIMLSRLFVAAQQAQMARQQVELAVAEQPNHPEVYLTLASMALAENRVAETILSCRAALGLAGDDQWITRRKDFEREARLGLATAFESRRDWKSARDQFSNLTALDPDNINFRQRLARCMFFTDNFESAYSELSEAARKFKLDPKNAAEQIEPAEVAMALLYSAYAQAIPTNDEDAAKKADAVAKVKKMNEEAEIWFGKAIEKNKDNPKVYQAYAGWLLDSGKLAAAQVHIATANQKAPNARETLGLRGLEARYKGDFKAAETIFEQLKNEAPADFFATNQLALVLCESSDPAKKKRAIDFAEVNGRQYQKNAEALATLGWVYFMNGRFNEADQVLGAAISGGQATLDTTYYLAKLLEYNKKYKEADNILKTALESPGVFVNRKEAEKLKLEIAPKVPKEEKK